MTAPRVLIPKPGRVLDAWKAGRSAPAIAVDAVDTVLAAIGARRTGRLRNLSTGWRNRLVAVDTGRGRMVVKAYRPDWATGSIETEHAVVRRLETIGFPAVRIMTDPAGESLIESGSGRYAVFRFSPGRNVASCFLSSADRYQVLFAAGRLLAEFHRALAGFEPLPAHHLVNNRVELGTDEVLRLERASRPYPELATLVDHAPVIRAALESSKDLETVRRGVVHGDYGLHNLLFTGDGPVLHDFELSRPGVLFEDLVHCMSRIRSGDPRAVLAGYEEVWRLDGDERTLFPSFWDRTMAVSALRAWNRYLQVGGARRLETAIRRAGQIGFEP